MALRLWANLPYSPLISRVLVGKIPRNKFSFSGSTPWISLSIGRKFSSQCDDENIVHSPLTGVKIPDILFHELIFENATLWGRKTAVICGRSGRKYSFRQLKKLSVALAASFQNKLKLSKGDVVGVILPNCPEYPLIFLAVSQSGTIMTTVNPLYTAFEIESQIKIVCAKILITTIDDYEKCATVANSLNISSPILVVKMKKDDQIPPGAVDLSELFNESACGPLKPVDSQTQDNLVIPFSSGTTGVPKGVSLTHKNLVSNLVQLSHPDTMILLTPTWFQQNTVLGILPMCHIFGLMVMTFFTLKEGCRLVVLPSFEPREFVLNLYRRKVTVLYAVPPLISFLTHKAILPRYIRKLKFLVNGAARYSLKDAEVLLSKAEHLKIVQGYGMTETSPVLTHTYSKRMQKLSSIGIPIASTQLKVVSLETGKALPARKEGELCALGPQVMKGYFERPEETKKVFDQHGWLKTGDLAYYDEDGDFFIIDRMKELIKVSGFQVSPAELEETLRIHPKVKDAVVVGVPNEKHGEVPKAYIIPSKKDDLTAEEVHRFVSEKLSVYKRLRGGVVFVEDFPKSHTGKILREELKKKH